MSKSKGSKRQGGEVQAGEAMEGAGRQGKEEGRRGQGEQTRLHRCARIEGSERGHGCNGEAKESKLLEQFRKQIWRRGSVRIRQRRKKNE